MKLQEVLLKAQITVDVSVNPKVTGVTCDSRTVEPGMIFVAVQGAQTDGVDFIPAAVEKGAVAVVANRAVDTTVPVIVVSDVRAVLAHLSTVLYPSDDVCKVAVTGTNGKTSTVFFVQQLMNKLGIVSASMGTIGIESPVYRQIGSMTTPDSAVLNKNLHDLSEKGVRLVALEASSHGLDQNRLNGIDFDVTAFTNITWDHLDYHGTMDAYFDAKMRLFLERTKVGGTVVLNADIPEYADMRSAIEKTGKDIRILSYGYGGEDLHLISREPTADGQNMIVDVLGERMRVHMNVFGDFQAMNILCAVGMCIGAGAKAADLMALLPELQAPNGRLEWIGRTQKNVQIFVDYAHTPDALKHVLMSLRPHAGGQLVCVFGCGGDRDAGKRPQMGAIAQELADVVYITDDNPRTENPNVIRAAIREACPKGIDIARRTIAIQEAIETAEPGDVVVIAGKGHETGQTRDGKTYVFSDKMEVLRALHAENRPILWMHSELALALNAKVAPSVKGFGVSIDTRTIEIGDIFVAIKGEKMDGHQFATTAIEKGAAAVVVDHLMDDLPPAKQIVVTDTSAALDALGRFARMRSEAVFIGVTGSSGKTTSKEMLRACLETQGNTFATQGNFNNEIGVPLMLARMAVDTQYAIIEMGMNHSGELTALSEMVRPDVTLITMIGSAHRAFFKTDADIALAKSEIFAYQNRRGVAVLNRDDAFFSLLAEKAAEAGLRKIVSFGTHEKADVRLINADTAADATVIDIRWHGTDWRYQIGFLGRHFAMNSLGVLAVVEAVGGNVDEAMQTLKECAAVSGRGAIETVTTPTGAVIQIIDDTYNANPASMKASLQTLGLHAGRKIAVLGDMLELGDTANEMHMALKDVLIENGIEKMFAVGPLMTELWLSLQPQMQGAMGMAPADIYPVLLNELKTGDVVLIKASNGMKLKKIIGLLKGEK